MDPTTVPYRYAGTNTIDSVRHCFSRLTPRETAPDVIRIAGRIVGRRHHGRVAFVDIADATGRLQLLVDSRTPSRSSHHQPAGTESLDDEIWGLADLAIGTWVGVSGCPLSSDRGELSVQPHSWVLLAACDRGIPRPQHGLTNPEERLRSRHLDLWARPEARRALLDRFRLQQFLRTELWRRGFLEVETPILHHVQGGASARPFVTHHNALDARMSLRIAPELHLKQLVVGGFERVFEMGRCFRNEGLSTRHNPEFTSVEIYEAFADYTDMMSLTEELVARAALELTGSTVLQVGERSVDVAPPWRRVDMVGLVDRTAVAAGLSGVSTGSTLHDLLAVATELAVRVPAGAGRGGVISSIYEQRVEPHLEGPVFVCDHPREVSPLARVHRSNPFLAERFEAVVGGVELANAYSELQDPDDQETQLRAQAALRVAGDEEAMAYDTEFVEALRFGLPPTGGLGIGVDRLAMFLAGTSSIRDVIAFPALRPVPRADEQHQAGADDDAPGDVALAELG